MTCTDASYNLNLYQENSRDLEYTVTREPPSGVGAPIPLDLSGGATPTFRVFTDLSEPAVLSKNGSFATTGSDGVVRFSLLPADTATLEPREYIFEVDVFTATGARYTAVQARLTIKET